MHLPTIVAVNLAKSRSKAFSRARRAGALASRQVAAFRQRATFLWELKSFVRESLLALVVGLVIVTVAGVLFSSFRDALLEMPGLVLLIPGALAMRGNIFASMGARLGTALHTGQLSEGTRSSPLLREEVLVVLVQTLVGSLFLAVVGRVAAAALGIPTIGVVELAVTAVMGALIAGSIEMLVTIEVAVSAHRRGWDPDNVTAPIISAVADLVSIPSLLGSSYLVLAMSGEVRLGLMVVMVSLTVALTWMAQGRRHQRAASVLSASIPVLLGALVIILVPALLLENKVEELVDTPSILILIPPFVAVAGNLGAILASRLSSAAHLGLITMEGSPDPFVYKNLGVIMLLSTLTFTALGVLTHLMALSIDIATPGLAPLVIISLAGGLAITLATSLAAYWVTVYTFRRGDDPDNVVIPIITSTMDALGTGMVLALFMVMVF